MGVSGSIIGHEEGQSIIEFLIMLPMILGLTLILFRVNSAIQVSIVNQQYSRAQILFLTYNNAYYPELDKQQTMRQLGSNQMVLGVSDKIADGSAKFHPDATVQLITRNENVKGGSDSPHEEPTLRAKVRIRNTVTLCTNSYTVKVQNKNQEIQPISFTGQFQSSGPSSLKEGADLGNYCGSNLPYE